MHKFQNNPIGRFTPPSIKDFVERARNVSRFLSMPRRAAEERLAKLYGYANAHDIRAAIAKCISEADHPGPYDNEATNYILDKQPQRIHSGTTIERGSACLDMASEILGQTTDERLSNRGWAFREIGLFDDMGTHRRQVRSITIIHDMIDFIDGDGASNENDGGDILAREPHEYATLSSISNGSYRLKFTEYGEAIAEVIAYAMHPDTTPDYADRDAKLRILAGLHPNNPYVHAARAVNDAYDIFNGHPEAKTMIEKAFVHYDAASAIFARLYGDMPAGAKHDETRCRSYMTPLEMDSSGMRIMAEVLWTACQRAGVSKRMTELRERLAFFNADPLNQQFAA